MSVLSHARLREVYRSSSPGPASIDLHLGETLLTLRSGTVLDPECDQSDEWEPSRLGADGRWRLDHLRPYLGVTLERVDVRDDHLGLLHGVSSLGRLFLLIHVTAGVVDPGWTGGRLTLELFPLGAPVLLRPGQRIGQITLHELTDRCTRPYDGRYQSDTLPQPSRSFLDRRTP